MLVNVYIETSIKWPKVGNAVIGIAWSVADQDARTLFGVAKNVNTYRATLYGLVNVLQRVQQYKTIHVHTSCSQVGSALEQHWPEAWNKSRWRGSNGIVVVNADLWSEVLELTKGKDIVVHFNEFNGYRKWLLAECARRAKKYER